MSCTLWEKVVGENTRKREISEKKRMKYQFPFAVDAHCLKCSKYYAAPPAFGVKCESRGKGGRGWTQANKTYNFSGTGRVVPWQGTYRGCPCVARSCKDAIMIAGVPADIHGPCYTQTLVHTDAFTRRPCHSQTLLRTDSCTHRKVYTQTPLHTDSFTHQRFHTQTLVYAGESTHRRVYTGRLLFADRFTYRPFTHTDTHTCMRPFTPDSPKQKKSRTNALLHTDSFTSRPGYIQILLHVRRGETSQLKHVHLSTSPKNECESTYSDKARWQTML